MLLLLFLLSVAALAVVNLGGVLIASTAAGGITTLCSSLPGGDTPGGVFPAPGGGAFVLDKNNGNLVFCNGGSSKVIAKAPAGSPQGFSNCGFSCFTGFGGITTSTNGVVLVLIAPPAQNTNSAGLWFCKGATATGCKSVTAFTLVPSNFCNNEASAICVPVGASLDNSLNLFWADPVSFAFVECTAASHYQACKNLPSTNALANEVSCGGCDNGPEWMATQGSTFYISAYCNGFINKETTTTNSAPKAFTLNSEIGGVAVSTSNPSHSAHVYAAIDGKNTPSFCNAKFRAGTPVIKDLTDNKVLPTPILSSKQVFGGLDSSLQFIVVPATSLTSGGSVYQTTDTA